ncbi:hypothetical protein [Roseiconus lacunae]|uniref:hypothetical protein n=1 Tax=Roseiconus lacunae TaxID=2605694 RepID=UPI001E595438|nr:hypothetical protein [Roseiconus lacunae]MCD0459263.1 hypothetical protein [Roseiconus lacunae]
MLWSQKYVAATHVLHMVLAMGWRGGRLALGTNVANLRILAEVCPSNNRPSESASQRRPAAEATALAFRHWQDRATISVY